MSYNDVSVPGGEGLLNYNPAGGVLARYAMGLSIDEPLAVLRASATHFYNADGLGSITSLTNAAGATSATYTYDTFGNLTASSGSVVNPFRYTAREWDAEVGLYYYRSRYYDWSLGRFGSEDSETFSADFNFYRYVRNQPVNLVDPDGKNALAIAARALPTVARVLPGAGAAAAADGPLPIGDAIAITVVVGALAYDIFRLAKDKDVPLPKAEPLTRKKDKCDDNNKRQDRCLQRLRQEQSFCFAQYKPYKNLLRACLERAYWRFRTCKSGIRDPGPLDPLDPNWAIN